MGVQFDGSINVGQIILIGTTIGGFAAFIRHQSTTRAHQVATMDSLGLRMAAVEIEMKKQTDILITPGKQEARILSLDKHGGRLWQAHCRAGR